MSRHLLIDADIVAYRFSADGETKVEWNPGETTYHADLPLAKKRARRWLDQIRDDLQADTYLLVLSDPSRNYFRHDLWPEYKQHRTQGNPPTILGDVKQFLREELGAISWSKLEADDLLGICATDPDNFPGIDQIIVSLDKDMATIPGLHFDYRKDKTVRPVTVQQADYNHMMQTLTGDTCDGFKGCPGIGPKRGAKILAESMGDPLGMWEAVVQTFYLRGLTEQDALLQARMARILRAEDYDFDSQTVRYWNAPQRSS